MNENNILHKEEPLGVCTFCRKLKSLVFNVAWASQISPTSKKRVRGGFVSLCFDCCKKYKQIYDNYEYDVEVEIMCEVLR